MRITIVNRHRIDALGGSEIQCDFIAKELERRGHNVTYVVPDGETEDYKTTYKTVACKKDADEIIQTIQESHPEIVYWRYHKNYFLESMKALHTDGVKTIFAVSSEYDVHRFRYKKKDSLKVNVRRFLKTFTQFNGFKYVDAVVVNNIAHLHKLPVKNQTYIPNGMSEEREEFIWDRPYCAWIANIKGIKRPELYIQLAKEFKNKGVDFLMVGAIQEDSYSWLKEKNNLPSNLYYLGPKPLEEVNGMLHSSLLHIHTCMAEGFPNVFIQAWLQSKPSISYGFDPAGYITDKKIGYCSNEDWETFTGHVKKLLEDEPLREKLGLNARKFAREMFDIEKSVSKLEEVIKSI